MENKCSTQTGCCEAEAQECCPTAGGSDCCPIEKATALWTSSFFRAMKETQVEILKAKIQKAWGSKMDKAADAVLEAMDAQWQSMLTQGKAKVDLKDKLAKIMTEGKK